MFSDEKIDYIQSLPEADAITLIWIRLLTMAGKCNNSGLIYITEKIPYSEESMAHKMKRPLNIVRLALKVLEYLEMIEFDENGYLIISNWSKHQNIEGMEKIKEQDRIRSQNYRDRKKQGLISGDVSSRNESRDATENVTLRHAIEEEEEVDKDLDTNISSSLADKNNKAQIIEITNYKDDFSNSAKESEKIIKLLQEGMVKLPPIEYLISIVHSWQERFDFPVIELAIKEAVINCKTDSPSYISHLILVDWKDYNSFPEVMAHINAKKRNSKAKEKGQKSISKYNKYEKFYL